MTTFAEIKDKTQIMELWEEEGNNPATRKNVICAQKEWVGE